MLKIAKKSDFEAVYALLQSSFPLDEYRTYDEQKALFDLPAYTVYLLFDGDLPRPAGMMAVWTLEDFAFLEHFAIDPALRNRGLGSGMLTELKALSPCPLCLEVELPDTPLAKRRIGFYERNGFVFHDYAYTQPPMSKGRAPVPLRIMFEGRALTESEFLKVKNTLYQQVYHVC